MEQGCYELKCSDVGFTCDYVAKAHSEKELMEKAGKHSAEVHDKHEYNDAEMEVIKAAVKYEREC